MESSHANAEDLAPNKIVHLHSVFRDTSPHDEGWAALANRADPLQSASLAVVAAATLGALAWGLRGSDLQIVGFLAAGACAGALGLLALVIGRALVRGLVVDYWEEVLKLRRTVGAQRRQHEALGRLLGAVAEERESERRLDAFAAYAADYARMVRPDCGLVVARARGGRFYVEDIGGRLTGEASAIRVGKSCPADRPFRVVLASLAGTSLATGAKTTSGEKLWFGLLLESELDEKERRALGALQNTFVLVVQATGLEDERFVPRFARAAERVT
jgi:hypothetical protein